MLGIAGLEHYTLALCSEHTLASNVTIWPEAGAGLMLAVGSALLPARKPPMETSSAT